MSMAELSRVALCTDSCPEHPLCAPGPVFPLSLNATCKNPSVWVWRLKDEYLVAPGPSRVLAANAGLSLPLPASVLRL